MLLRLKYGVKSRECTCLSCATSSGKPGLYLARLWITKYHFWREPFLCTFITLFWTSHCRVGARKQQRACMTRTHARSRVHIHARECTHYVLVGMSRRAWCDVWCDEKSRFFSRPRSTRGHRYCVVANRIACGLLWTQPQPNPLIRDASRVVASHHCRPVPDVSLPGWQSEG